MNVGTFKGCPTCLKVYDLLRWASNSKDPERYQELVDQARRLALDSAKGEQVTAEEAGEMIQWAFKYGSRRLRRSIDEGVECRATYQDERLAHERPGWRWIKKVRGKPQDARDPPMEAFGLLDEAQRKAKWAWLTYWYVTAKPGEGDGSRYLWSGYAVVEFYLDAQIIYFGPEGPPFEQGK